MILVKSSARVARQNTRLGDCGRTGSTGRDPLRGYSGVIMCAVWRGLSQRVRSCPNGLGDGVFLSSGAVMVPLSEPSLLESSPARVTIEVCVAYIDRGFRIDPPRIVVGACVCVALSVQTQVMQFLHCLILHIQLIQAALACVLKLQSPVALRQLSQTHALPIFAILVDVQWNSPRICLVPRFSRSVLCSYHCDLYCG